MFDEDSLRRAADIPGYCGPLADERPQVQDIHIRPFVWAHLLWTCGVRVEELLHSVSHLCRSDDLKTYTSEISRLEAVVKSVLTEFLDTGILRLRPDGLYVLNIPAGLSLATSVACATNSQIPPHAIYDLALFHLPNHEGQRKDAAITTAPSGVSETI